MPKFIIRGSRQTSEDNVVEFDVNFLESRLTPGYLFTVYDTHHPRKCKVIDVISKVTFDVIRCEMPSGLGWENQFINAVVDTEAKDRPESFGYPRPGS